VTSRRASALADWLAALEADTELGRAVRHRTLLPGSAPELASAETLAAPLGGVLRARGIGALYRHQARALAALDAGRDVVLATPTASGKSLVYTLPSLAACLADPEARALLLFPLRALEQDQRKKLEADVAALALPAGARRPRVAIYDGDTPQGERRRLRADPPQLLITTPDMLHLGLLPQHESWSRLFGGLGLVVLDELHSYRGVLGAHVAQVMRRLERVARHHGARPRFVCASATIANPAEHAFNLTGRSCEVVEADSAARAPRHVLLLNPGGSSYTAAARLFRLAVSRGLRTIAFTKARRVTELLHRWIASAEPALAPRISSYRAGFLPEERRAIERALFEGELVGVISTSALELGIDVGGLDVCILVGYPGSQVATWQRAGRVGRDGPAAIALVAQPDALDQYLVAHPRAFLERGFEHAVLDPEHPEIRAAHLPCAAAELPLRAGEAWLAGEKSARALAAAEERAELLRSESGREWFAARRAPHRAVSLRAAGARFTIQATREGAEPRQIGTVGSAHVFLECHEGAIYLHHARAFRVTRLDLEERKVWVEPSDGSTYTRALSEKETSILSRERTRPAGNFRLCLGRVRVTTRVTGYERRRVRGQELLASEPLDLPPTSFETTSLWLELPDEIPQALARAGRHVMGSLHAVEHAALALFPLFALCDRFDVAGISYRSHPELGGAAIFLYDAYAGGLGLAAGLFERLEALLEATRERLRECPCETGCPGCVHSARCGNGNRPIDKAGALDALELLLGERALALPPPRAPAPLAPVAAAPCEAAPAPTPRVVFFDLETQRSAEEVGGWHNAHLMRLALAVCWDGADGGFHSFREAEVHALLARLAAADLVVGFNSLGFDYRVLRGYSERDPARLPSFDLLAAVHARLGFRLSLGHLGEETLGVAKGGDGLQALRWWREGRVEEIERYCRQDVAILRDLFEHARAHGFLLFRTRRGERVRLPLRLSLPELLERAKSGAGSVHRGVGAQAAVEQLEVEQHQHAPHRRRELGDEAPRFLERLHPHHLLDREVHLGHAAGEVEAQPLRVLLEGVVDGVGVEQQVDAALADLEEPLGVQHAALIGRPGPGIDR
jgi:DEAD/DEAH box helicase domain-containing protein